MANADGAVTFVINISSSDAEKDLARLRKKFLSLEEDLTVGHNRKTALEKRLEQIDYQIDEINRKKVEFGGSGISESEAAILGKLTKEANELDTAVQKQKKSLEETQMALDGVRLRYAEVKKKADQVRASTEAQATAEAHVAAETQTVAEAQASVEVATQRVKAINQSITRIQAAFHPIITSAKNGIERIFQGLKSCAAQLRKMFMGSKSLSKSFGGVVAAIKRIAPALLVARGVMGILRKAVSAYMEQNQQLANTLSSAWTGLGNILGPVIERMVNLLANAVAYFTKFLSLLGFTGKAASKQISSAGSAAKKETEELKKSLLSIDTLEILSDKKEESGGGGGGGVANINLADSRDVELPNWAKQIAELFKSGEWAEAAKTLTSTLNNMIANADWNAVGEKLGYCMNNAMTFLTTAVKTFNWKDLGEKLATAVNGIVKNVNWENLGNLLSAKFQIALQTLAGFITGLDMPELADALSTIATGIFDGISGALDKIKWEEIGTQIKDFLTNIRWSDIAESAFTAVKTAFNSAADFLKGFSGDFASDDVDAFTSALSGLNDILIALQPFGQWLWKDFLKPIAEWTGNEISDKLKYLSERLEKIGDWAKEHKDAITAVAKALTYFAAGFLLVIGAVKLWTVIAGLATTLTAAFAGAIAFLTSPVGIAALVVGALFAFSYLMGHGELFAKGIGDILGGIVDIFLAAFTGDIPGILKGFCRFFKGVFEIIWSISQSIADVVADVFDWVVQKLHDLLVWAFGEVVDTPIEELEKKGFYEIRDTGYYVHGDDWAKYGEDVFNMPEVTVISPEEIEKMMAEWLEKQKIDGWTYDYENDKYINDADSSKTMSGADGRKLLNIQNGEIDGSPLKVEFASGDVETSLANLDGMLEEGTQTARTAEEVNKNLSEDLAAYQQETADLETAVSGAADKIIGSNSNLIAAMNNAAALIASSVSNASRTSFDPHMPYLANPRIPHLAKGTVIPPRAPFLAVLGDQRNGTNIEAPLSTIQEATASREMLAALKALDATLNRRFDELTYTVSNIDDSKIGKMANRYNRGLDRAWGR